LLWGTNLQVSWPAAAAGISQAKARGAKLIVIDPRKTSVAEKADLWLQVQPGSDGALALAMIHVLLQEKLYDERFVRQWTNGAFLVRTDTHRLLTEQDLSLSGNPDTFVVWDGRHAGSVSDPADHGDGRDGVEPALAGAFPVTLANGKVVECWPAFALLKELAAHYAPERSEAMTWTPVGDVR
jgi:anaerobic selenocysteine-containing dehydrogenase